MISDVTNGAHALLAISLNTFREAVRNKVFGSLVFFAILIICAAFVFGEMSLHEEVRIARDLTLFASAIFTTIIAVYSSVSLLHSEIERRTIYTILSKPIRRWQFLLGKFLGIMLLVAAILLLLWSVSAIVIVIQGGALTATMAWAYVTLFLQMTIVAAFALFFASFSSSLLSGMLTVAMFIIGNLFSHLDAVKAMLRESNNPFAALVDVLQAILPNLESLNLAYEVTYSVTIPGGYILAATWYALSYAAIVLVLAMLIFSRRDFI